MITIKNNSFNPTTSCERILFYRTLHKKINDNTPTESVAFCEKFTNFVVLSNQQTYFSESVSLSP